MIVKQTFFSSGNQKQDVAAELNAQIRDYLVGTGVFRLVSAEIGDADRPKYTLEYKDSGYQLILQSHLWAYHEETVFGVKRGALDVVPRWHNVWYGKASEAAITIHLITSGNSFAFKVINAENKLHFGGSCIRYTDCSGKIGYLYNSREENPLWGYMGRYEVEPGGIAQLSYVDYASTKCAVVKHNPIICYNDTVIGYANDLVVVNGSHLADHNGFSCLILGDKEYHGGRIACGGAYYHRSRYAAAAMKNE